jgi:hypothetical protein
MRLQASGTHKSSCLNGTLEFPTVTTCFPLGWSRNFQLTCVLNPPSSSRLALASRLCKTLLQNKTTPIRRNQQRRTQTHSEIQRRAKRRTHGGHPRGSSRAPPPPPGGRGRRIGAVAAVSDERVHVGAGEPVAVPELHLRERVVGAGGVLLAAGQGGGVGPAVPVRGARRRHGGARAQRQPHARARPPRRVQGQDAARQRLQQGRRAAGLGVHRFVPRPRFVY